jgi:hypothetical protein
MNIKEKLIKIADGFDKAPRIGELPDIPEGKCHVVLSDTLVRELSKTLRLIAENIVEHRESEAV